MIAKGAILSGLNQAFKIQELEWDDPRDDEVGIRVQACGVCHSDWHCTNGDYPMQFPCLTGHEGGGVIESVGQNVTRFKVGDKVVMSWMPSCGHCWSCVNGQGQLCDRGANLLTGVRDDGTYRIHNKKGDKVDQFAFLGAFSEYVVIPEDGCIAIDQDFDLLKIPIVGCRAPTGVGAVINTAKVKPGSTALVIGLGGVGFNVIQGLKVAGARLIIAADIAANKKQWALDWGAHHFIDASKHDVVEEVMKITGFGVDYAFDAIGKGAVQSQCVKATHKGGLSTWIGVAPIDQTQVELNTWNMTLYQQGAIGTCYGGASPFEMVPQLMGMYRSGIIKLDELITKYYKLDQINDAFADMLAGKNICGCLRMY
ncbi:MAG: Zn-dependent alcohol dehydrogenase [Actinobacteria bacterium]|nr:Zn-dependent alcohol dehydrogenase [Actinomycetota bacterium]